MRVVPKGLVPALLLFVVIAASSVPAAGLRWHLAGITPANQATANTLHQLGIDHLQQNQNTFEVVVSSAELDAIRRAGLAAEMLIEDYGAYLYNRNQSAPKLAAAGTIATGGMGGYFGPDEILGFVDSLRSAHGGLIGDTLVIGESLQGRPVWLVEVGGGGQADAPEVFFNSLIHAREGMSVMSLLYFLRYLAGNYESVDSVRWLVDNRRITFLPLINPDGYEINWRLYTDSSRFGLWRKNARDNNKDGKLVYPTDGVDLNRNFSYKWGYDNLGSTSAWANDAYRGDSAFSEPETRNIRELVASHNFKVALNCHTWGNHLLKPWSYIAAETPDSAIYDRIGSQLVAANGFGHGNATTLLNYPANGEFTDWEYGDSVHGGIFAWTPEIGESRYSFWPPSDQIDRIAANMLPTFFGAARAAGFWPTLKVGRVSAVSSRGVHVEVIIDNLGLQITDKPYTVTVRDLGTKGSAAGGLWVGEWPEYPLVSSVNADFAPEVYQMTGTLVLEQDGLVVTSVPITLTRTTRDVSGDLDGSGKTDIFDLLDLLTVLKHGVPQDDNPDRYDLNADGKINIFDLLDHLARLKVRN